VAEQLVFELVVPAAATFATFVAGRNAEALAAQPRDDGLRVLLVCLRDREHPCLEGCEPRRERSCVVLEQDAEEPFDGPEQRTVQHDRAVAVVVRSDVLELEPLVHVEVVLDGRQLP